MIVVSDTTPLNYLIQIEKAEILHHLFERVVLPEAVFRELVHKQAPTIVREWVANAPEWIEVRRVATYPEEPGVDRGEAEALALAIQISGTAPLNNVR